MQPSQQLPGVSDDGSLLDSSKEWLKPNKKFTAPAAALTPTQHQPMEVQQDQNKFASLANVKIHTVKNRKQSNILTKQLSQKSINDDDDPVGAGTSTDAASINKIVDVESNLYSGKCCPPIILKNVDVRKLVMDFQANSVDFSYRIVNKGRISKLYIDNSNAHRELMNMLRNSGDAQAYSFTLKEDKTTNVVLRGLTSDYPTTEILNELKPKIPNVSSVSIFETLRSKQEKINYNLFLVRLQPGTSATELTKIKYLFHTRVYWEKPRGNRGPLQCRRCQQFGHLAKNCAFAYKCVKCTNRHEPGSCPVVREQGSKAVCVNCGEDHPANFRGCKLFKQYEARRKLLLQEASEKKANARGLSLALSNGVSVAPGVSFASLLKPQSPIVNNDPVPSGPSIRRSGDNIVNSFMALSNDLFGYDMRTLLGKIENFMSNLGNFNSIAEKRLAYLDLVSELLSCSP